MEKRSSIKDSGLHALFRATEGTKQTDRVVVYITFDNGDYKKTNDELRSYRTRG